MCLQVGGGAQKAAASSWKFLPQPWPQLQLYSWNFHQPQGASSASRTVLILPECCSVSVVFISWESLGSPGIKGVPPRLFPCLKTLACLQKWLWSGEDDCSGGRALFSYTQKAGLDPPHCMYQVKSQQSWGRGRNLRHTVQWFSPFSVMWPLIYFLKLCCPSLKLFRCYFITEISLI